MLGHATMRVAAPPYSINFCILCGASSHSGRERLPPTELALLRGDDETANGVVADLFTTVAGLLSTSAPLTSALPTSVPLPLAIASAAASVCKLANHTVMIGSAMGPGWRRDKLLSRNGKGMMNMMMTRQRCEI